MGRLTYIATEISAYSASWLLSDSHKIFSLPIGVRFPVSRRQCIVGAEITRTQISCVGSHVWQRGGVEPLSVTKGNQLNFENSYVDKYRKWKEIKLSWKQKSREFAKWPNFTFRLRLWDAASGTTLEITDSLHKYSPVMSSNHSSFICWALSTRDRPLI